MELSFKSIVNGWTDGQRTNTNRKSSPCHYLTGELKMMSKILAHLHL